ncbi:helix-turn-helix transcriptional regulator [bacterium]|nr:helix-turn-helix transcriptional regulator [bacterium]
MKLKNYTWNGFGFPVIFEELPAVKLRGELVPDIDFTKMAPEIIKFICADQDIQLSGNQVKFFRHSLNLSMRDFAKLVGVTHVSLNRWEKQKNHPAKIDAHTEIVLRIIMLKKFGSNDKQILSATNQVEHVKELKEATYKQFKPLKVPESVSCTL